MRQISEPQAKTLRALAGDLAETIILAYNNGESFASMRRMAEDYLTIVWEQTRLELAPTVERSGREDR